MTIVVRRTQCQGVAAGNADAAVYADTPLDAAG